jgi:cell division protein FtsB
MFLVYSDVLKQDLEVCVYPFAIGETGVNWSLMLGMDMKEMLKEVRGMTIFTLIIAAAAVIIFVVSRRIAKPIIQSINQSASITETNSTMEQVTVTINKLSVKGLREASEVGREGIQEAAGDIQEIVRESEGVLEINSVTGRENMRNAMEEQSLGSKQSLETISG